MIAGPGISSANLNPMPDSRRYLLKLSAYALCLKGRYANFGFCAYADTLVLLIVTYPYRANTYSPIWIDLRAQYGTSLQPLKRNIGNYT